MHADPKKSNAVSHILVGCVSLHSYTIHVHEEASLPNHCCAMHYSEARKGYSGLTTEQPGTVRGR